MNVVEKFFNGNCKENIETTSFSDTPFYVKYYINIAKSLVLIYIFSIFSHPNIYQCEYINQYYKDRNIRHNQ